MSITSSHYFCLAFTTLETRQFIVIGIMLVILMICVGYIISMLDHVDTLESKHKSAERSYENLLNTHNTVIKERDYFKKKYTEVMAEEDYGHHLKQAENKLTRIQDDIDILLADIQKVLPEDDS